MSHSSRLSLVALCLLALYAAIAARLIYYGTQGEEELQVTLPQLERQQTARPDIVDRNGVLLATDIDSYSLFADPRRIVDVNETVEMLATVLPDLDWQTSYAKLKSDKKFVWIERGLNPKQKAQIMALGLPGIGFRTETRRLYPSGSVASHVLGLVNIDNQGIAGMEKYIDGAYLRDLRAVGMARADALEPVQLSLDLRVQAVVRDELMAAMERYRAIAAGNVVLNIKTGEVVALVSLPDFDPNLPDQALEKDRLNRMSAGTFEMGSTIKSFTTAMALDSGMFHLDSVFDASKPIYFGGKPIRDFHAKNRALALWEVFVYSSNIGSVQEAAAIGIEGHRQFLHRLGLLSRMTTELPEIAHPVEPRPWRQVHAATIAFGHGMMTTPLQTAVAAGALMNGGKLLPPTFLHRSEQQAMEHATQVIQPHTSQDMRHLYRLNAEIGSGRRVNVPGYRVGGKTGTAEKVEGGRYVKDKRFNAFLAAFPMDDPTYVVLTIIDEPQPETGQVAATAGLNAAPVTANIIRRTAGFLGIAPDFHAESMPVMANNTSR